MDIQDRCFQYSERSGKVYPIRVTSVDKELTFVCVNDVIEVLQDKCILVNADYLRDAVFELRFNAKWREFGLWLHNLLYHTEG